MPTAQLRTTMNRPTFKSPSSEPRLKQLRSQPETHGHVNHPPATLNTNHRIVLTKLLHHYRPAPITPSPNTHWAARISDSRAPHQPNKRLLYRTHQAPPMTNRTHWTTPPATGNNHHQANNSQPTGSNTSRQTLTPMRNRRKKRRWTRTPTQPTIPHQAKGMKRQEALPPWQISKP